MFGSGQLPFLTGKPSKLGGISTPRALAGN